MDIRYFILFRNEDYAKIIEGRIKGHCRNTESEILGIRPIEGDVFLIDAHFGGQMSQLNGLDIARRLIKFRPGVRFKVKIYSWLTREYISQNYPDKSNILKMSNVQFNRFPVIIS